MMKLYRFKTFTTSYYFPHLDSSLQYMYGLYSPYGGRLSKIYWWLFRHSSFVRSLTSVNEKDLEFPYSKIKVTDGNDVDVFQYGESWRRTEDIYFGI